MEPEKGGSAAARPSAPSGPSPLSEDLLAVLTCPGCAGGLRYARKERVLVCSPCRLAFSVLDNGIPNLCLDEAARISPTGTLLPPSEEEIRLHPLHGPVGLVDYDAKKNGEIPLRRGTCILIARSGEDMRADDEPANLLNLDLYLNDNAKKLLERLFADRNPNTQPTEPDHQGRKCFGLYRLPDLFLRDPAISKVHGLFFYDHAGPGIVDLLSRNGTFVNQKEVEFAPLASGDIVQFGQSAVSVVFPSAS